ncbi:Rpn family recombination-promoting nuclease/putative transposase [Vibrio coralliilyticus]|uniref:Rpn family recombination-promoting nuclease/putative transposase n=1 Tax=Vibrio coralliilyticus TaxID=190893 RepID=UPI001858D5CA|nr:Rpn family recombination-promoting nuclease/putative transposase [Vibrio coralliilyticus]NUW67094.1 Rpn family recombination-promoting nuclease/putative transposase [Vibrio coralliilyticus]
MKKGPTSTPHDGLFKVFLTTPETARDFLDIHLPAPLRAMCDLSTLQLQSGSFLEEGLKPYYSDILYSMDTTEGPGYVYALIEHQSRPDKHMAFRMMRYAIAAMQQHLDAGHDTLPLVVPLLFYHGRVSPYPYRLNWLDGFHHPELAGQLYSESFPLVDVTVIPDEDIMQHKRIALLELVQKHIRERDMRELVDALVTLLLKGYTTDTQVKSLMEYIVQVGETSEVHHLMTTLAEQVPEHGETLMTIAEQLRRQGEEQGIQKGRQEGRQEGLQEAQLEIAKKMLLAGSELTFIQDVTGLSEDELTTLININ